jgi:hypothetical protein
MKYLSILFFLFLSCESGSENSYSNIEKEAGTDRISGVLDILVPVGGDSITIDELSASLKFKEMPNAPRIDSLIGLARRQSTTYLHHFTSLLEKFEEFNSNSINKVSIGRESFHKTDHGNLLEFEHKIDEKLFMHAKVLKNFRSGYFYIDYSLLDNNEDSFGSISYNYELQTDGKKNVRYFYDYEMKSENSSIHYQYDTRFTRNSDASGHSIMGWKVDEVDREMCRQWTSEGFINDCN